MNRVSIHPNKFLRHVAIIGAGITGLSLAVELTQLGLTCVLIDVEPFAAFASRLNQGWLHSGFLYLTGVRPDKTTTKYCQKGYQWIMSRYPQVIQSTIPAYALYSSRDQRNAVIQRCRDFGIEASPISMQTLEAQEPLLRGSRLRYAVRVLDHPFNTCELMRQIAEQAHARGAGFCPVSDLHGIRGVWDGASWHLFLDNHQQIEAKIVILSCGGFIPNMIEKLLPGRGEGFQRTKTTVLSLSADIPLSRSMLITPIGPEKLSLVPFHLAEGSGVTVNIPGTDELIADCRDYGLPISWQERYAKVVPGLYPSLKELASQTPIRVHPWVCQKLSWRENNAENSFSRKPIHVSFAPEEHAPENVIALSPGKFTAAPIVVEECVANVVKQLQGIHLEVSRQKTELPTFAVQKYCEEPEYQFVVHEDKECFIELCSESEPH